MGRREGVEVWGDHLASPIPLFLPSFFLLFLTLFFSSLPSPWRPFSFQYCFLSSSSISIFYSFSLPLDFPSFCFCSLCLPFSPSNTVSSLLPSSSHPSISPLPPFLSISPLFLFFLSLPSFLFPSFYFPLSVVPLPPLCPPPPLSYTIS